MCGDGGVCGGGGLFGGVCGGGGAYVSGVVYVCWCMSGCIYVVGVCVGGGVSGG